MSQPGKFHLGQLKQHCGSLELETLGETEEGYKTKLCFGEFEQFGLMRICLETDANHTGTGSKQVYNKEHHHTFICFPDMAICLLL